MPGTSTSSGRRSSRARACPAARAAPPRSRYGMKSPVWTPPADRVARRRPQLAPQVVELLLGERARGAARERARHSVSSASRLPTPAIDALVEQPRLQRHRAAAHPLAEDVARDLGGVRADVGEVRLDHRAASRRLSRSASRPPSANSSTKRSQLSAPAPRRPRSAPPSRDAGRDRAPPSVSAQRNLPRRRAAVSRGRSAPRRSRPARAGGRRRCRGRRRRRSRAPMRARSAGGRVRPRGARASPEATTPVEDEHLAPDVDALVAAAAFAQRTVALRGRAAPARDLCSSAARRRPVSRRSSPASPRCGSG